jgi:preprotein translocase subunit SecA
MSTEFNFKGTIISSDENILDEDSITKTFLETKKTFTKRGLDGFLSEMHMRNPSSFQQFIIDISNIFVQVDLDVFSKKSTLDLDSKILGAIKNKMDFVLSNQSEIDTSQFTGYFLFPQVRFKWNKHSLVGIVRSYFYQYYTIEYTNSQYQLTNYIIRRG